MPIARRMRPLLAVTALATMVATSLMAGAPLHADWVALGEVPDGSGGPGQPKNLGLGGAFVGTHNHALVVAGGSNFPVAAGDTLWSDKTVKISYDRIWVATLENDQKAHSGQAEGRRNGSLVWHDAGVRLPRRLAYGASASNQLGMFLIGGTDGKIAFSDARLLRWDAATQRLKVYTLPSLPVPSMEGGAAIIAQTLYVLVGSNGSVETADLYALDLTRIDPQQFAQGSQERTSVVITPKPGDTAEGSSPWRKLASIPSSDGHSMARSKMMLAAQLDGRRARLFVFGGQRIVKADEYPSAAPAGFGAERPLIHFYNDAWAFTPGIGGSKGSWRKLGNVGAPFDEAGRAAGSAIALAGGKIALLTSAKDDLLRVAYGERGGGWATFPKHPGFERGMLIYDVRKDKWAAGPKSPVVSDPLEGKEHPVSAAAVTTSAVCFEGRIVLPTGEVRPRVRSPQVWAIDLSNFHCSTP